jgi:hypothetical protein
MQINHFTNNTNFTPPSKGGALGATRLTSPANTQRVGNSPTVIAKTTARKLLGLLQKTLYKKNASGPAKAIRPIITNRNLDYLRTLIGAPSGILSTLEADFLKMLLKLSPQELREEYVDLLYKLRRFNAIILGIIEKNDPFSDPLYKNLIDYIDTIEVK